MWYQDADLETAEYGWGIRAASTSDDIGNSDYDNGAWIRINLSVADRVKADKGDLLVSASSLNYEQGIWNHYCSLKLFFDDANGSQLDSAVVAKKIDGSAYPLNITDKQVPAGTASIRYYVSNWGGGTARPFIGGLKCWFTDKTAPEAVSAVVAGSDGGAAPAYTVPGESFSYLLDFDEKLNVSQSGTAAVALNGASYTGESSAVIQKEDGTTQIRYNFVLPLTGSALNSDGTVKLSSVSGLQASDEAGNALGAESVAAAAGNSQTLTFYGLKNVTADVSGLTFSGESTAVYQKDYVAYIAAVTGYNLPSEISVEANGHLLAVGQYTYNNVNGEITVTAKYVTGDIVIAAAGVPKQYTVNFERQDGTGGSASVTATYNAAMPSITPPARTGYTFGGYFTAPDGGGTQYYSETDEGTVEKYSHDGSLTLYAKWTANAYNISCSKNVPAAASGEVTGSTTSSTHTYDVAAELSANGYALTGWTFSGWATSDGGGVVYSDGESVINLSVTQGATVTLYAVWEANTYTVYFVSN